LHKWLLAIHLMCSSKKGISAHQLMRNLEIGSYRTAWFLAHRIRWALGQEPIKTKLAGIVEIDETWVGGKQRPVRMEPGQGRQRRLNPRGNKAPVVAILERGGDVRSTSVDRVTSENIKPLVDEAVEKSAILMTDSATPLKFLAKEGHVHHVVDHHAKEYVRHEDGLTITTNTVEGYFSILKRGNYGIYHHWDAKYMDQYLREFDFRYNVRKMNDQDRTILAIKKTSGKRLMLKEPKGSTDSNDSVG
jgi:transposase-like protein